MATAKKAARAAAKRAQAQQAASPEEFNGPAKDVLSAAQDDGVVGGSILGHDLVGPAAPHEDHEGGETDSLARQGVRGPVPHPGSDAPTPSGTKGKAGTAKKPDLTDLIRPASIRERQTRVPNPPPLSPRHPVVQAIAEQNREELRTVRVIALQLGFYDQRRRRPGDVFDYVMLPEEQVLPRWLADAEQSVKTRRPGQGVDGMRIVVTTTTTGTAAVAADLGAGGNAGMSGARAADARSARGDRS